MAGQPHLLADPGGTCASGGPSLRGPSMGDDPLVFAVPGRALTPAAEKPDARLRRMVRDHFDPLWRFLRRLGVYDADLDDAMQEVIVIAAERLADIPHESERSFLFGTAFRVGSEHRRRREGRREVGEEQLVDHRDPLPEPDALSDQARARALLDGVLETMPSDLRAVFALYEIEEMTMAEIAQLLALPPGTVASRLRRAREQFEREVERIQERGARLQIEAQP